MDNSIDKITISNFDAIYKNDYWGGSGGGSKNESTLILCTTRLLIK